MTGVVLPLLPFWHKESVVLVCAEDALRLCRDGGHQALPWGQGRGLVEGLARRDRSSLREFVLRLHRWRLPVASLDDDALLLHVRDGLRGGTLVVLRVCHGAAAGQTDPTARQRRLVRKIEAATRGRLELAGQRYKLVAGADLGRVPGRDHYVVVRQGDAKQILGALAGRDGISPQVRDFFSEAQNLLTADWRAPFSPDGLVLLHRLVMQAAIRPPAEAPITPSQMKQLLKDWIEIEVVDDKGRFYAGRYRVDLPSGGKAEGDFPKDGQWSKRDIDPGECKLTLLCADAGVQDGDGDEEVSEDWLSLRLVNPDGKPVLNRRYRIDFADGSSREDVWTDEELRMDGIPEGKCALTVLPAQEQPADEET
jgi:hypothetical protein